MFEELEVEVEMDNSYKLFASSASEIRCVVLGSSQIEKTHLSTKISLSQSEVIN